MTTGTTPKSPLDGLVSCGRCGAPMDYVAPTRDHEAQYACNERHCTDGIRRQPVGINADTADRLVITGVLDAVLTERSVSTVQSAIKELDEQQGTGPTFPAEDISLLKENADFFIRAVRGAENARNFLAMFITRIELFPDRMVVQYAIPLPADSRLGGATEQEIYLPVNLTA